MPSAPGSSLPKSMKMRVPPEVISVPAIREYPLTLECRVLYRQVQDETQLPEDIQKKFYSVENEHVVYYGEIVDAYMIED